MSKSVKPVPLALVLLEPLVGSRAAAGALVDRREASSMIVRARSISSSLTVSGEAIRQTLFAPTSRTMFMVRGGCWQDRRRVTPLCRPCRLAPRHPALVPVQLLDLGYLPPRVAARELTVEPVVHEQLGNLGADDE
jgi:hypothetical protein